MVFRFYQITILLFVLPLCGCYEIVQRIVVRPDLKVVMSADIRLQPAFFTTVFERKGMASKSVDKYREGLIEGFKERMKFFDTSIFVDETLFNVITEDSVTVIHAELILPGLKHLHNVNRLFWSGLVTKPDMNLPSFPNDMNISMKGDTLPVIEIAPVAAKYQLIYGIESIDIENVNLYSDLFDNKLCTFSFSADKFIKYVGVSITPIEGGAKWQFPSLDLLLHGRTSFRPVTIHIDYPYGVMEITKENQPAEPQLQIDSLSGAN